MRALNFLVAAKILCDDRRSDSKSDQHQRREQDDEDQHEASLVIGGVGAVLQAGFGARLHSYCICNCSVWVLLYCRSSTWMLLRLMETILYLCATISPAEAR